MVKLYLFLHRDRVSAKRLQAKGADVRLDIERDTLCHETHERTPSSFLMCAERALTTSWEARGRPRALKAPTACWIWETVESSLTAARRRSRVSFDTGIWDKNTHQC